MEPTPASLDLSPVLGTRPGLRLLSYLALLPASSVELDAAVERAVAENPMLERTPWHRCPTCGLAAPAGARCPACRSAHWTAEPEAPVDWRADLLHDAALELPSSLHQLLAVVVAALDDHGLMPDPPDARPDALSTVVAALRLVGPPGVGARSPLECLQVQAHRLVDEQAAPLLVAVVADEWLPEVAEERYDDVAAGTGASTQQVAAAVRMLRDRTRPFVLLPGGPPRSAPTDVVFTQDSPHADVVAHVAGAAAAGVGLAPDALLDLQATHTPLADSPTARAWAAPHLDAARRLLAAVTARSTMLQGVADELARRQRGFLVEGPAAHAPLRRTEVARALGVHPSTVGRAVAGKVARCPDGRVLPLADLFGTTPALRALVEAALARHPGTPDREIADLLTTAGHPVARRTVAKYRALADPSC